MHTQMVSVKCLDMQACGDANRPKGENPGILYGNVLWLQGLNNFLWAKQKPNDPGVYLMCRLGLTVGNSTPHEVPSEVRISSSQW